VVVIIFAIISCVPPSDRKTVVTGPVTVILPARIKVTQFEYFLSYPLSGKTSNNNKINNDSKKKLSSSPTMTTK